jgi:hypothetical protein
LQRKDAGIVRVAVRGKAGASRLDKKGHLLACFVQFEAKTQGKHVI